MSENSYLREFSAQVSRIVFLADLIVLRLITTVSAKMSENSYLREFSAQVSEIVFLADLTFLRPITTLWAKISGNSHLREFSANGVLSWFDRFCGFLQLYELKLQKSDISVSSVHKYHKSCS